MKRWMTRMVNRISGDGGEERTRLGQLLSPRREDSVRDYPTSGLTPSRLVNILREADAGSLSQAMQLYEEMEEKDPHLYAVANKRRLALTGLEWRIVSAADVFDQVDRARANEVAEYCRGVLRSLEAFDDLLEHLSLALGRNIAIGELVWDRVDDGVGLVDLVPVDFGRIVFNEFDKPRILTDGQDLDGIELVPNKFVVHTPHSVSGHPSRGGLLRVTALSFLAKNLALKDWMIFAEIFGMPVRIARYDQSITPDEKQEMLKMLESLGSNAAGIFSRAVELQFIESGQGKAIAPYGGLIDFLNREMSKAWLGQTLTTETPGLGGSFGATKIHEQVRKDLRANDLRKEARTVRRDILGPMVCVRFGSDAPVPFFQRQVAGPRDLDELTTVLDAAVNRLGVDVSKRWARESLGIPEPEQGEALLAGK